MTAQFAIRRAAHFGGLIGKIMIAALFVWDAIFQFIPNFSDVAVYIGQSGLPWPRAVAVATIIFLIIAPLALFIEKVELFSLLALSAFCLLTAFIFHQYWDFENSDRNLEQIQFMKDFALSGAMLAIFAARFQLRLNHVLNSTP